MLVGSSVGYHLLLLREFAPYVIIFMNVSVVITLVMVWYSFIVTGFWGVYGVIHNSPTHYKNRYT
jgi:hypothetical protein